MGSGTFRFLVGPNKRSFELHSALASHYSPALKALIMGPMTEAMERCALFEDIDKETSVRFCEYDYTGDYPVPSPGIVTVSQDTESRNGINEEQTISSSVPGLESEVPPQEEQPREDLMNETDDNLHAKDKVPEPIDEFHTQSPQQLVDTTSSWLTRKKDKKKASQSALDFGSFGQTHTFAGFDTPHPQQRSKKDTLCEDFRMAYSSWDGPVFEPYKNCDPSESFTEIFLCHARLYAFADRYQIDSLRTLVLYKLRRTLAAFRLFPERVPDIFELVQFSYANTREPDDLRNLVTEYVVCFIEYLVPYAVWGSLLEKVDSFAAEVLTKVLGRID
jgi:hypothetical protein